MSHAYFFKIGNSQPCLRLRRASIKQEADQPSPIVAVRYMSLYKFMRQGYAQSFDLPPFTSQDLPTSLRPKVQPLIDILNSPQVDIRSLRNSLSTGIPDEAPLLREYAWKIALGYLPRQRKRWQAQTKKHEQLYAEFVRQFLHPGKYKDSPIALDRTSPPQLLAAFEQDHRLWEQIQKDTCRTQSQLSFFSSPAEPFPVPFFTSTRREKHKLISGEESPRRGPSKELTEESARRGPSKELTTYRYDYMTRILFVFARLNPKVEYVQGMNEILAPIFYVVNHRRRAVQEAACFYMFNALMTDTLELHMRDFARQENGVHERMRHITTMLLAVSPKTWLRLQSLRIDPFYYSFRWITLLFSQEFQLFETLRLWESILAAEDRTRFVNSFALALVVASRERIAASDYGQIMAHLKSVSEHISLEETIAQATHYYERLDIKEAAKMAEKNRKKMEREQVGSTGSRLFKFLKTIF